MQKWKKLARERPCSSFPIPTDLHVREKRPQKDLPFDEIMEDVEERGNFKKRVVPMDTETVQDVSPEEVAGPTKWALGCQ